MCISHVHVFIVLVIVVEPSTSEAGELSHSDMRIELCFM